MATSVKAYLANQMGFSELGRYVLDSLIIPKISEIGITVVNPFAECAKEYPADVDRLPLYEDRRRRIEEFSRKVAPINHVTMRECDCLLAMLDGGHQVDEGVAEEIGYYTALRRGPIFALRSDFRSGENMAVSINPQLWGAIIESGGALVDGPNAVERWFEEIEKWYRSFAQKQFKYFPFQFF